MEGLHVIQQSFEQLQPRAQSALADSPIQALRELQVEQDGPVLRLHGCVSSFYHKQLAQEAVRSVAQDVELVNSICVREMDDPLEWSGWN